MTDAADRVWKDELEEAIARLDREEDRGARAIALGLQKLTSAVESLAKRTAEAPPAPTSDMLTIRQAAALLCVSTTTIGNWLKDGRLTRYGRGRAVRLSRIELLKANASRRIEDPPSAEMRALIDRFTAPRPVTDGRSRAARALRKLERERPR